MEHPSTYQPLRITRELVAGRRFQIAVIALLCLLSTAGTLTLPLTAAWLVATIQSGESVLRPALTMVGVGIAAAVSTALTTYLVGRIGQKVVLRLRDRVMRHVLRLPLADVRREGAGNLSTRLTADSLQLKSAIDIGPVQLPMAGLTVIGTLIIMWVLDWVLLLAAVASFAVAGALVAAVTVALRRAYLDLQGVLGYLAQRFVAALDALPVIKAYRAEARVGGELARSAERAAQIGIRAARIEAMVMPAVNLGQQVALVTVIIGGGARLLGGHLSLAAFAAFLLYLLQLTAPLIMAASSVSGLQAGLAARRRFDDLLSLSPERDLAVPSAAPGPETGNGNGNGNGNGRAGHAAGAGHAVAFDRVSFSYDGSEPVLDQVSLQAPATGLTALVGPSGAGKSTVLALVERFVLPDAGGVSVAGRDLAEWQLDELRSRIAYVDQRCTLLTDTVRANLTLGRTGEVPEPELWQALTKVGLAETIASLPDGLDTMLGEGIDLSGGERQRLALSRALLSRAPIILLDEPSSQLDSANEEKLRQVIDGIAQDRAVVVVAHRLSTIRHATRVIMLDRGRVVASGSHEDLLGTCPAYEELVRGQALTVSEPAAAVPQPATA